jgi:two-component system alkaline phosphatase synthesis response regulator PhoP
MVERCENELSSGRLDRSTRASNSVSHILIVEDDKDIADLIAHYLQKAGHAVDAAASGTAALAKIKAARPALVLLDLMLPGMDGLLVCQTLRRDPETAAIPIIMLTARGEEAERIAGLELGADDYVTKPFSPGELVARVSALLRRAKTAAPGAGAEAPAIEYGPIRLDVHRHLVTVDGAEVKLTAKEFLLLQYLMEHRGRLVSRDVLLRDVWGYQFTGGTRTVDVHVRRLREKIALLAGAITTIKQFGYRLEDPADRP